MVNHEVMMTSINAITLHLQPNSKSHLSHIRNNLRPPTPLRTFNRNISIRKHRHCVVPCCLQKSSDHGHNEDLQKSSERLYAWIGNENLRRFFEKIEDESQILRYVPVSPILQSMIRNQGAWVLSSVLAFLVDHVELVFKPTLEGGPDIGFRWSFGWNNGHIPLGPVFSLSTTHSYTGKIFLRNGKVLMNPLIQLEPLKKLQKVVEIMIEKIIPQSILQRGNKGLLSFFLALLFMVLSLILWKGILV